nr:MAG: ORF3 [Giant panda anellovirus]
MSPTSEKTASSNPKRGKDLPEDLLKALSSLITQEKRRAKRKLIQTHSRQVLNPLMKKRRVRVPRDPEYLDGPSTEAELSTSSDSDTY